MAMMNARKAIASLNAGGVVFDSDLDHRDKLTLDMLVSAEQAVRCQAGEFIWYIAYDPKPSESALDKAMQMAKAINRR